MTEDEKTRALLTDELTGLGNRFAWDDRDRMSFQALLDVEGLKWVNDSVGWRAGDELLRVVAAAIHAEGLTGYRLGGDEFVFEAENAAAVEAAVDGIRRRLESVEVDAVFPDGSARRLRGPRVHAGIGRSLDEAAAALIDSKRAGIRAGERAERGARPRGLAEVA
jgi:GGDEF domain-containing protein